MKPIVKNFEFVSYEIKDDKRIYFHYRFNFLNKKSIDFTETVELQKKVEINKLPPELIFNLLSGLHLMLGVNYYKVYCPKKLILPYKLTEVEANFWNKVYREGLGEFYFRNNLSPKISPVFPVSKTVKHPTRIKTKDRALVGIGGGKDSMVAAELLKDSGVKVTGFVVPQTKRTMEIISDSMAAMKIGNLQIKRTIDPKIKDRFEGGYQGHFPISGVFAFLGLLAAVLYDYKYVVVGNEQSSNFGNTKVDEVVINHQWSKSSEFESLFQDYVKNLITPNITYFSILRPFDELRIVEIFTKYKKYYKHFTSCNRNFRQDQEQESLWCGECPKCLFIYLLFAAFLTKKEILGIFGHDLFENKDLLPLFKDILGIGGLKPFDCVGTFDEAKVAFHLAKKEFKDSFIIKELSDKIKVTDNLVTEVFRTAKETNIPDKFKFIGMKNALILGYDVEGKATEKYLQKKYPKLKIGIADQKDSKDYLDKQKDYDIVVKTPGIPKEKITSYYTTATNIFFSEIDNLTIGVTGTKGKSTVSSLVYEIIKTAGRNVRLVGNIGQPMLASIDKMSESEIFVVELSSYQLDDIHYSPTIAVVLNLYQDHMTYHGGLVNYHNAKKNIIGYQTNLDVFVYNQKFRSLKDWICDTHALAIPINDNEKLRNVSTKLIGEHNLTNINAADTIGKLLNIKNDLIYKAIMNFNPLEHRLEYVGERGGIKFFDDSISTTPESTIAAINCFEKVGAIILGGTDRGYDFAELEKVIRARKIKNIILFPDSGKRILKDTKGFNILKTNDMIEAVKFGFANSQPDEVVLLSPASPSFTQFKDYKDRGDQFQKAIENLK